MVVKTVCGRGRRSLMDRRNHSKREWLRLLQIALTGESRVEPQALVMGIFVSSPGELGKVA
jgi:hypothetical protein